MRISHRPPSTPVSDPSLVKKTGWSGGATKTAKRSVAKSAGLWSSDELEMRSKGKTTKPTGGMRLPPPKASDAKAKPATDYKSGFIMADLTGTVAHQARLEMLDVLEEAHAKSPGGIFYADRRPDRKESHISIIEVPVDDLSKKAREKEKPDAKSLAALYAVARGHGPIGLQLNDSKLEVFDGPRGPDKLFTVLSLAIVDPNDNLAGLRSSYRDAGGKLSEKSAPMHLTLAYLKLGTKLDAPTEKRLLQIATRANLPSASSAGQPGRGWKQSALYYSGRYSDREFARLNLGE